MSPLFWCACAVFVSKCTVYLSLNICAFGIVRIFVCTLYFFHYFFFFFSSRRRHTRWTGDWSSDVCSSDLVFRSCRLCELQVQFPNCPADCLQVGHPHLLVFAGDDDAVRPCFECLHDTRSEERRVGKECRSRWVQYN